jgi:hypothetical protein
MQQTIEDTLNHTQSLPLECVDFHKNSPRLSLAHLKATTLSAQITKEK